MKQLCTEGAEPSGLGESEAHYLAAAMLDGGVADLELGAVLALLRDFLLSRELRALLLEAATGEGFADPGRRPRLEYLAAGESHVLFEAETGALRNPVTPSGLVDARTTAAWIRRALAGEVPIPLPLVNQLACCLFGAGYAEDMKNQAKAIVAVETGSLIPV